VKGSRQFFGTGTMNAYTLIYLGLSIFYLMLMLASMRHW
jgi:hypothetical protein